jgi:hypothetical protein
VHAIALHSAQLCEARFEYRALIEHRRLPAGGERVAAEERGVQRDACLDREPLVLGTVKQREGAEVLGGLLQQLLHVHRAGDLHSR